MIVNPEAAGSVCMKERESPATYLEKCRRNIAAELWGLFETKVKPVYPAWRDKMDKVFFSVPDLSRIARTIPAFA